MPGHWQLLYEFPGRPKGLWLSSLVIGTMLLGAGLAAFRLNVFGKPREVIEPHWTEIPRGGQLYFVPIIFGVFILSSEGFYSYESSLLSTALRLNKCTNVEGRISQITPAGYVLEGYFLKGEFLIGDRRVRYDNHALGFSKPLCTNAHICEGDYGRLCMVGKWIGRIEKWSASTGPLSHDVSTRQAD